MFKLSKRSIFKDYQPAKSNNVCTNTKYHLPYSNCRVLRSNLKLNNYHVLYYRSLGENDSRRRCLLFNEKMQLEDTVIEFRWFDTPSIRIEAAVGYYIV